MIVAMQPPVLLVTTEDLIPEPLNTDAARGDVVEQDHLRALALPEPYRRIIRYTQIPTTMHWSIRKCCHALEDASLGADLGHLCAPDAADRRGVPAAFVFLLVGRAPHVDAVQCFVFL